MRPGCWSLNSLAFIVVEVRQPIVIVVTAFAFFLLLLVLFLFLVVMELI